MKPLLHSFVSDERGLETVEYAVLLALILVALIGAIEALTAAIRAPMGTVTAALDNPG
jgi:Flp pilus assembly pilin Flp